MKSHCLAQSADSFVASSHCDGGRIAIFLAPERLHFSCSPARHSRLCMWLVAVCWMSIGMESKADDPVFSGPQPGEKLPALEVEGVIGEHVNETFDLIKQAADGPVLLVFFHERTRPAFGLTNTLMKYAVSRKADGLTSGVVFLTADPTDTKTWLGNVQRHFHRGAEYTVSPAGIEGPGSYGLNRNVVLTILIAKSGVVTHNFALVQPSVQADGPKILKALVETIGSGEVPDLAALAGPRYRGMQDQRTRPVEDPALIPLIRAVINKQATEEQVHAAAKKVETYVAEHPRAAEHLGRVSNTVVKSDRLKNYGTSWAQTYLKKWAQEFPSPPMNKDSPAKPVDSTDETR